MEPEHDCFVGNSEKDPAGSSGAETPRKGQGEGRGRALDPALPLTGSDSRLDVTFLARIGWNSYLSRVICIRHRDVSSSVPGSHGSC